MRLADYMDKTPTLLVLGYFTCPDLCPMAFMHLAEELNGIAPVAGRDFQILIISFDPRDTPAVAAGQKKTCLRVQMAGASCGLAFSGRQSNRDRFRDVPLSASITRLISSWANSFIQPG